MFTVLKVKCNQDKTIEMVINVNNKRRILKIRNFEQCGNGLHTRIVITRKLIKEGTVVHEMNKWYNTPHEIQIDQKELGCKACNLMKYVEMDMKTQSQPPA